MKKLLLLLALCTWGNLYSQTHQLNHQKYWYYRYRMNNHYIIHGTNHGESLVFGQRGTSGHEGEIGDKIRMGDQTIHMGQYMAVLALEYNMLAQNNQNTDQTVKELWHLLYAFNRLDMTAENLYRHGDNLSAYTGPVANLSDLNGFFVRDDLPQINRNDVPNPDSSQGFFKAHIDHFTSDKISTITNQPGIQQVSGLTAGYKDSEWYYYNQSKMWWDPDGLLTQEKKDNAIFAIWAGSEESYDQVYRIMLGMAMIQKLVPSSVTYQGQSFQDGETSLKDEAKAILDRVIFYANGKASGSTSDWHHLRNPARTYFHPGQTNLFCNGNNCSNLNGDLVMRGNWSGYNWAVAEASKSMTGNFNEVNPLYYLFNPLNPASPFNIPYTTLSNSPYHTLFSKTLGYYEWRGSNLAVNQWTNDNAHMAGLLSALIGVSNVAPFYWDLYAFHDIQHLPLIRQVLHGGVNPVSNSWYTNFLNLAPCNGPYKWSWNVNEPPNQQSASAPFEWSTGDRLGHPEQRGRGKSYNDHGTTKYMIGIFGEYAGIDYMLYHNLYYTVKSNDYSYPTNDMNDFVSVNLPILLQGTYFGTNAIPLPINKFQSITASNIIYGTASSAWVGSNTGNVTYRAGEEITLKPGFNAQAGSEFHAYIQPFTCATDGSYRSASDIVNENLRDGEVDLETFNLHEESQDVAYQDFYYDDRDPEVFPFVEMAAFDASFNLGDTSSFGAYLANFVSVYPNPTNDFTQINIPQEVFGNSQFQVEIYNMVGVKVFSKKYIDQNILNLDFSSYSNGIYIVNIFMEVEGEAVKMTKKVIKQ